MGITLNSGGAALLAYSPSATWLNGLQRAPHIFRTLLNQVQSLDRGFYYFLSRFHGKWVLDRLALNLEANVLLKSVPILAVFWYFWFIADDDQVERRGTILAILAGTLIGLIVTRFVAGVTPFRVRPLYDSNVFQKALSASSPNEFEQWSSFPSDHAAYLVAMGAGAVYLYRRFLVPIVLFLAFGICLPRLYLGIHYLSDIVAGAAIGMVAVLFTLRNRWFRTTVTPRVLAVSSANPQLFYAVAFLVMFELGSMFWSTREVVRALLHLASVVANRV